MTLSWLNGAAYRRAEAALTLMELLAVVTVIVLMASLVLGLAGYAQRRTALGRAQGEIRTLEAAIEDYKSDTGGYPTSAIARVTGGFEAQRTNSALLYEQLVAGPKSYATPSGQQVQKVGSLTFFADPYGIPYDYYRPVSNLTTWAILTNVAVVSGVTSTNLYAAGGLHNPATFDLSSYGSDHHTYVPGIVCDINMNDPWRSFGCPDFANDDITNWSP